MKSCLHTLLLLFVLLCVTTTQAQKGFDLDIKKPKPYEDRELKAEKSGNKKFTVPRRVLQNTFTHYNYFFNTHNKLNEVLDRAKLIHKDDYATLLPFYNYSIAATAQDKNELDSVIYKSKTGIVLHDLRNDWIDDLYFLWGQAYYLQSEFDSAYQMFQFINYSFAEKEKDGYYKYIGSRLDGATAASVATNEKLKFPKGLIADPPIRNDALLWEVRTLIQKNNIAEAGSLISILKNDVQFPARLRSSLEELQALWFYKQNRWDSAAIHLVKALGNAANNSERARWEYLAAQLFQNSNNTENAETYYNKAIVHTTDPVMEVYARLNLIRLNKDGGDKYIDENIEQLVKMARREKYTDYRDVIYNMAGQMELERNNFDAAQAFFLKAAQYKGTNNVVSGQSFLVLADLLYSQKNYIAAASFYDSIRIENMTTEVAQKVTDRKAILERLVKEIVTVQQQDSLLRIAALPEAEREDYVKKLVRRLRRQQGLKEDAAGNTVNDNRPGNNTEAFGATKGEWYFYNAKSRSTGAATFKQVWRDRPNIDNWRKASSVFSQLRSTAVNNTRGNPAMGAPPAETELSYDGLMGNLPLTDQKVQASNDLIAGSLFSAAHMYTDEVEDYESAVAAYEELNRRFPAYKKEEVLFGLYYGYTKTGQKDKAEQIKKLLSAQGNNRYAAIVTTGKDPQTTMPSAEVTKTYEGIYDLFVAGKFAEANAAKQKADSIHRTNYWSPQLLYVQAVYYIQQRQDSVATGILNTLIQQNGGAPIAAKADNLKNVLSRRAQIEQELISLQIERPAEEKPFVEAPVMPKKTLVVAETKVTTKDTIAAKPKEVVVQKATPKPPVVDTATKAVNKPLAYTYNPEATHYAVIVLNQVDVVFGNEAKNAFARYNREAYYNRTLALEVLPVDEENKLLLIGEFTIQSAIDYVQKATPIAATEIMPWLKKDRYTFTIISADNLNVLKQKGNLAEYKKFLEKHLPVKF